MLLLAEKGEPADSENNLDETRARIIVSPPGFKPKPHWGNRSYIMSLVWSPKIGTIAEKKISVRSDWKEQVLCLRNLWSLTQLLP